MYSVNIVLHALSLYWIDISLIDMIDYTSSIYITLKINNLSLLIYKVHILTKSNFSHDIKSMLNQCYK